MSTKEQRDDAQDRDFLGMSDDEFMEMDPTEFEGAASEEEEEEEDFSEEGEESGEEEEASADDSSDDDDAADDDNNEEEKEDDDETEDSDSDDSQDDNADAASDDADDASEKEDKKKPADKPVDGDLTVEQYADVGRQIMGEFKANGRVMRVKSAEDAIQLMQMGANYHKKMAGLKPALKNLKLLEQHGLMDAKELNYLIDLHQKKPEAIARLMKDAEIDPMTMDVDSGDDYTPSSRAVSDKEMLLDEVLDSIQDSPKYNDTLNVLGQEWDDASKAALANEPELIRTICNHMEAGVFDKVADQVAYERSLGKLTGVSDFDAYQRVGEAMHKQGLLGPAASGHEDSGATRNDQRESQDDSDTIGSQKRRPNKKAVSNTRQKPAKDSGKDDYDPLNMSDEEFERVNNLNL